MNVDDEAVDEARKIAQSAENFILALKQRRWGEAWDPAMDWAHEKVTSLVAAYVESGRYPIERLVEVTLRAADVRLQPEYIMFDLGLINQYWYAGPRGEPASDNPASVLARMALTQSTIVRVRILWEKIFRLVHFLEEGKDLAASGRKSMKGLFFAWASANDRFRFLEVYEPAVSELDEKWRTGEVHKHSKVRSLVIGGGRPIEENQILLPMNQASSVFGNIIAIVRQGYPESFSELHMTDQQDITSDINPRYRPPNWPD